MQKNPAPRTDLPLLWPCVCMALLAGCASLEWYKTDTTDEARDRDAAECTAQARAEGLKHVPMLYPHTPGITADRQSRVYPAQSSRYENERFMAGQDARRECMRKRGYELQKRPDPEP